MSDCAITVAVKQALKRPEVKIVNLQWLLDSIQQSQKVSEATYQLSATNSSVSPGPGQTKSQKGKQDNKMNMTAPPKVPKRARKSANADGGMAPDAAVNPGVAESSEDDETGEPPAKKQKDGQKAQSGSLIVPVDEGCGLAGTHKVYLDQQGTIYDASLNQTNIGDNNNKFYRVQLLESPDGDYKTWTRWGRVGERGQSKLLGSGSLNEALAIFDKKFKDKSGHSWINRLDPPRPNKYTFIERNYEEDSSSEEVADDELPGAGSRRASKASLKSQSDKPLESTLTPPVQRLMELIFNQKYFQSAMASMSYDANKLPLGKLSKRTLKAGYQALKDLAEVLSTPSLAQDRHSMSFNDVSSHLKSRA